MKSITVFYPEKREIIDVEINNDLYWYDNIKKEMCHFKGSHLDFEYKEDDFLIKMGKSERLKRGINTTYRLVPKATGKKIRKNKTVKDVKKVKAEIKNFINYNDAVLEIVSENNDYVNVLVPDNSIEDFCYHMERQSVRFKID